MKTCVGDELRLGSAPDARAYFLFSCKKKVAKENARPQRRPAFAGCSALLSRNGGLRNSDLRSSDSPRPFSRRVLRCSTTQRADQEPTGNRPPMASGSFWCASPSPSCSAEQRSGAGGSRRGLSEGQRPEFRSRPASRVAQGSRQRRPRNAGVAFFLVTFSWRRKKKLHAVRAGHNASRNLAQLLSDTGYRALHFLRSLSPV